MKWRVRLHHEQTAAHLHKLEPSQVFDGTPPPQERSRQSKDKKKEERSQNQEKKEQKTFP